MIVVLSIGKPCSIKAGHQALDFGREFGHKSISTTERHCAQWARGRQDRFNKLVIRTWDK